MKKLLFLMVVITLLSVPMAVMAVEEGTPSLEAFVCRTDAGRAKVVNNNLSDFPVEFRIIADGEYVTGWTLLPNTNSYGFVGVDVEGIVLEWSQGEEDWVEYLNVVIANIPDCNPSSLEAPSGNHVLIIDPDGVLPVGYPMELLTQGGTLWGETEIWYNDNLNMIGFTVYGLPDEVFNDGLAWLHSTNGDDILIRLTYVDGAWLAEVVSYYEGGYVPD